MEIMDNNSRTDEPQQIEFKKSHDFANTVRQSEMKKKGYTYKVKKCRHCGLFKITFEDFSIG